MIDFQRRYDDELPQDYQDEFDFGAPDMWDSDVAQEAKWLLNRANEVDVRALLGHDWSDRLDVFLSDLGD